MTKWVTSTKCPVRAWCISGATILALALLGAAWRSLPAQQSTDVLPTAAAQIAKVTPDRATVGSSVTIEIEGSDFSSGAYVSFSTPAVRVVSTDRQDATKIRTQVEINASAMPGAITLFVSNPAGPAAQIPFTVVPPAGPPSPSTPGPQMKTTFAPANAPEVKSVEPTKVGPGSQTTLKIKGKGFVDGANVSFSNPGIRVLATRFQKSSELAVDIQVASDAATGSTSLFVVNPDDSEVEHAFEISGAAVTTDVPTTATTTESTTTSKTKTQSEANEQKFEVYNVGEAGAILHNPTQAKGTLILGSGKLRYEEGGKEVFSVKAAEIQEIATNVIFGINTGTFHVILRSSKTYNFASATLRPADTQAMVESLRRALQMN